MTAPVGYGSTLPLIGPGVASDRALQAIRDLVRACLPQLALLGLWDYRIDDFDPAQPTIAQCSPVDPSLGLPGAIRVTLTPSILGERVEPHVGSRVVIAFLDGNAGKPVAILGDPDVAPDKAILLGGTLEAARKTDAVGCGTVTATTPGGPVTFVYTPQGGTPQPANPTLTISGVITGGSSKIKVG